VFQAYQDWLLANNGREIQLPNKNMTNEKYFFVAFAQVCAISSILILILSVKNSDIYESIKH